MLFPGYNFATTCHKTISKQYGQRVKMSSRPAYTEHNADITRNCDVCQSGMPVNSNPTSASTRRWWCQSSSSSTNSWMSSDALQVNSQPHTLTDNISLHYPQSSRHHHCLPALNIKYDRLQICSDIE